MRVNYLQFLDFFFNFSFSYFGYQHPFRTTLPRDAAIYVSYAISSKEERDRYVLLPMDEVKRRMKLMYENQSDFPICPSEDVTRFVKEIKIRFHQRH